MKWVPDRSGRFAQRPFWTAPELDAECERLVTGFLVRHHGAATFPISTDDLTVMVEEDAEDLDSYADLSSLGSDVEGVTDFYAGRQPRVRIDRGLAADKRRANRYRTTLTHEYGHVRLHGSLWDFARSEGLFDAGAPGERVASCRRDTIAVAPSADWMEWQAAYASGALLMPVTRLTDVVAAFQRRAGEVGSVQSETPAAGALVTDVEHQFGVSQEAAKVRLTKLGHLDASAKPESGLFDRF